MLDDELYDEFQEEPAAIPFNSYRTFRKNKNLENLDLVIIDKAASIVRSEEWQEYEVKVRFVGKKILNGIHYRDIRFDQIGVTKKEA